MFLLPHLPGKIPRFLSIGVTWYEGFCGVGDSYTTIPPIQEFLLQSNQPDKENLVDYSFVENIQFPDLIPSSHLPPPTGLARLTHCSKHPVLPGSTLETGTLFTVPFVPKALSTVLEGADLTVSRSSPGSLAGSDRHSTVEHQFAAQI